MRIGSAIIETNTKVLAQQRVAEKASGAKSDKQREKEMIELKKYEDFQRLSFENMWLSKLGFGATTQELHQRALALEDQISALTGEEMMIARTAAPRDGVHVRRLRAELWAVDRVLTQGGM